MGFFDAVDKLASLGAGSTMSDAKLDRAKNQSRNTNTRNELAARANGGSVSRAEQRQAQEQLVRECGGDQRKAERLKKQAAKQARRGFFG